MDNDKISSYKKLIVWQKSVDLVSTIYETTSKFPKEEKFGLATQLRRAAVSIPSNIAEGSGRNTRKDFVQFIHIALGSISEVETQVLIAYQLKFIDSGMYSELEPAIVEIKKMLTSLRNSLMR